VCSNTVASETVVKEAIMAAETLADLDPSAMAQLLFACPLQPSGGDLATGPAAVAQEAADHPDSYVARMHWTIQSVVRACAGRPRSGAARSRAE
jgi:hypothetical protein